MFGTREENSLSLEKNIMVLEKKANSLFSFFFCVVFIITCLFRQGGPVMDICPFHVSALSEPLILYVGQEILQNDQLHLTDTVFLCTNMSLLIEDTVKWIAGK